MPFILVYVFVPTALVCGVVDYYLKENDPILRNVTKTFHYGPSHCYNTRVVEGATHEHTKLET